MTQRLDEKELAHLLNNEQYPEIVEKLKDVVKGEDAKFNELAAFIISVSEYGDRKNFPLAFDCFVRANLIRNANPVLLRTLYLKIENVIKSLGLAYFDNNNSHNIKKDFYLRARFLIYITSNKFADAIQAITALINERPLPSYYFQRSKVYVLQKKLKLALKDLDTAIENAPTDGMLYYHRGLLKQRMNDIQGALFDFDSAVNFSPDNSTYYYKRGVLYEDLGRFKNALDDFKKSVQLNPTNIPAFQELAWCKYNMQSFKEAMYFADIATKLDFHNAGSHYVKGFILTAVGMYNQALEELEFAAQNDNQSSKPWSARLWFQTALASFLDEQYEKARADIAKALQIRPNIIPFLILAMDIEFFGKKDFYSAKGYCQAILKLDPENQRALSAQVQIDQKLQDDM